MLTLILFAALATAPQAKLSCANGASVQTQSVSGPSGATAVLKVSSEDDHSKNSHECNARYELMLTSAGSAPRAVDLTTSDDDWGRELTVRLSGFSQDGKHVLGTFSEGGKHPFTMLFDVRTEDGAVELIDLREKFPRAVKTDCLATFESIGTTSDGGMVLEQKAASCAAQGRWTVDESSAKARALPQSTAVVGLYGQ